MTSMTKAIAIFTAVIFAGSVTNMVLHQFKLPKESIAHKMKQQPINATSSHSIITANVRKADIQFFHSSRPFIVQILSDSATSANETFKLSHWCTRPFWHLTMLPFSALKRAEK